MHHASRTDTKWEFFLIFKRWLFLFSFLINLPGAAANDYIRNMYMV